MPLSQGKELSYESMESCIEDAKAKGVSSAPCRVLARSRGKANNIANKVKVKGY